MEQENKEYIPLLDLGVWNLSLENLNIRNLTNICYQTKKKYPSVQKSNKGGYQSGDVVTMNEPLFYPLISKLNKKIQNHYKTPNMSIIGMWVNISSPTHYNTAHTHIQHVNEMKQISGVLYIQTPLNSGNFTMYNPVWIDNQIEIRTIPGQLLLFNKILTHSVSPNNSKDDRISIAFNCNI